MLAILFGLLFLFLGLWGIVSWFNDFTLVARGLVPAMLSCGGILAIIAGITSVRDKLEPGVPKKDTPHAK